MANSGLKDRDAIITKEEIIFRVYGYWHPPSGFVCDVEYAPSTIYKSNDPRAPRTSGKKTFYKFYNDGGFKFITEFYPQYQVFYTPLQRWLVGVNKKTITHVRHPNKVLLELVSTEPKDELLQALDTLLDIITTRSYLQANAFGVFGSLLHGFYHPQFSDIDLIVIGKANFEALLKIVSVLYREGEMVVNEFSRPSLWNKNNWRFTSLTLDEYAYHQQRKLIYGVYLNTTSNRAIKIEFEPVKSDEEIINEYDSKTSIDRVGWIEASGRVIDSSEGAYIPSIYEIEIIQISTTKYKNLDVKRIVSFIEEFRMQVRDDEMFYVAGNLEKVTGQDETFYQITLTHGPRYYDQVLKKIGRDFTV